MAKAQGHKIGILNKIKLKPFNGTSFQWASFSSKPTALQAK